MRTRVGRSRLVAFAVVSCALAATLARAAAPAPDGCRGNLRHVPGLGLACPSPEGWRLPLDDGSWITTHGGDPIEFHGSDDAFDVRVPPACVDDPASEVHGHVIYARAADQSDRFAETKPLVVEMVELANGMLREEASRYGRRMDYRMRCDAAGTVAVDGVLLATPLQATTFLTVVNDLRAQGYHGSLAKYWVLFDGRPPEAPGGTGTFESDDAASGMNHNNFGPSYGVTWGFTGPNGARIMMHENGHNIGAVQNSARHSTLAAHCTDGLDVMCYDDGGPRGSSYDPAVCATRRFDCGGDDYFNPAPGEGSRLHARWNLGSPFDRAVQGCLFATDSVVVPPTQPRPSVSVGVPAACRGRWFAAMAYVPPPPVSPMPSITRAATYRDPPDLDVCWLDGELVIRCDTAGATASGTVPAAATAARLTLQTGAAAIYVLSVV